MTAQKLETALEEHFDGAAEDSVENGMNRINYLDILHGRGEPYMSQVNQAMADITLDSVLAAL